MGDLIPQSTIEITLENGEECLIELHSFAVQDKGMISLWLRGKRSTKTVQAYQHDIYRFYQEIKKPLREVKAVDIYDFRDSLMHLQPTSRHRTLAALKSLFSKAKKSGYLEINPMEGFELPKLENKLAERILSEQAVQDIIDLEKDQRNHAILSLLYYGGLRVSEVCNLTWRNLQERNQSGQIAVYGKGKKTRYILLDTETWMEVWALKEDAPLFEYVFQSRQNKSRTNKADRRISEARVFQIVRTAADRAGVAVGKVSPHWFRHAHATYALENGATVAEVMHDLGHERPETVMKYTHIRPTVSTASLLRRRNKHASNDH